jgi:hypothetical protein
MAVQVVTSVSAGAGSGSTTPTVGSSESSLATITAAGTYQLAIDVANMVDGTTPDILEIRVYGKARTGDTERLIDVMTLVGEQTRKLFIDFPRMSPHHWRAGITQTQGTARAFPYAVYQA